MLETWRNQAERRYELERDVAKDVLAALDSHLPVVTYLSGPATTLVSTIYFDTPDGYYYDRARSKTPVSSIKLRAREYLPVSDDGERRVLSSSDYCYLERKERTGSIRNKQRIRLAKQNLDPVIERLMTVPEEAEVIRQEIHARGLVPILITMYERRVWGSGDLRITFDERIRYYRAAPKTYSHISSLSPAELGEPDGVGPKRILEVKQEAQAVSPDWLQEALAAVPEAAQFSKFLDGMNRVLSGRRLSSLTRPIYTLP